MTAEVPMEIHLTGHFGTLRVRERPEASMECSRWSREGCDHAPGVCCISSADQQVFGGDADSHGAERSQLQTRHFRLTLMEGSVVVLISVFRL